VVTVNGLWPIRLAVKVDGKRKAWICRGASGKPDNPRYHRISPVNAYIRNRLRADAGHLVARAEAEEVIAHKGLRGRFRELLVDTILAPWLPPYAACGTGTIVDVDGKVRESTQEDVVVFDRSLAPAVFAHASAREGMFPYDGVLVRVEVKSTLTRPELRKAVLAAGATYEMHFCGSEGRTAARPISAIFAFKSDLTGDAVDELARLLSVVDECGFHYGGPCKAVPGPIPALCVVGRGSWGFGGTGDDRARPQWLQAKMSVLYDEILHFVGTISNSCFNIHMNRQGVVLDPTRGVGGGIGNFILSYDTMSHRQFKSLQSVPS